MPPPLFEHSDIYGCLSVWDSWIGLPEKGKLILLDGSELFILLESIIWQMKLIISARGIHSYSLEQRLTIAQKNLSFNQ